MIKLTTPEGIIYIRKNAITAICEANRTGINGTVIKTQLWIDNQEESFNILEDVETVFCRLS